MCWERGSVGTLGWLRAGCCSAWNMYRACLAGSVNLPLLTSLHPYTCLCLHCMHAIEMHDSLCMYNQFTELPKHTSPQCCDTEDFFTILHRVQDKLSFPILVGQQLALTSVFCSSLMAASLTYLLVNKSGCRVHLYHEKVTTIVRMEKGSQIS